MSSKELVVAALGRPFTLGMLYDARTEKLVPGITLWDDKTKQVNTVKAPQPSSEFQISTSDSTTEKCTLLDVDASLKASFLSGLIQVGGSGKYMNDKNDSHHVSRVTLQYKVTTEFKQLFLTPLDAKKKQQIGHFEHGMATHVVTGITYGAHAFFVFDSEKSEDSTVQDIQGHMEAVIKKIPSLQIEGDIDLKLTDKEKDLTDKFSCKFFGDFVLKVNPTTFADAVKTYVELPTLLGENGENAVPVTVWLMPLKTLHFQAPQVAPGISAGLAGKAEIAFEDLHQLKMRCNASLGDKVVQRIPQIQKKLTTFQQLCNEYTSTLQEKTAKNIQSIKEGKKDESELAQIFEERRLSPFSNEKLNRWMECMEREITVIRSCVDIMDGIQIVSNNSELDRQVLKSGVEDAFCFVFTSVENENPYIEDLANYSSSLDLGSVAHVSPSDQDLCYSDKVLNRMREDAQAFQDLSKRRKSSRFCFLIAAIANDKYQGASIYHYNNGILITDCASKPEPLPEETITDRTTLLWYACDLTLDPNTAHKDLTLSDDKKKAIKEEPQSYPDCPERFTTFPQVLCREGLMGCCYWEIEWSNMYLEEVAALIAYQTISRETYLGGNDISWSLVHNRQVQCNFLAQHSNKADAFTISDEGFKCLGMFLNTFSGTLTYYRVSGNTLTVLYTFRDKFTELLYPALRISTKGSYIKLL
ncbi:stonustoxin subunit alpha-like [Thalassophryne amazonica]|uniref:stonustoxin subunit alpha-like n=1 Tax=Thalassophryne amazonica TaxID=390379 RepID=UPI001470A319|nr:stonustoxin subunit alpha-like [Thalassophryne amazonica]